MSKDFLVLVVKLKVVLNFVSNMHVGSTLCYNPCQKR
ncbi:MAG: hypothetical protein ACD_3C00052G0001 [uncultured bacterium (gcode 4)]|uniref:Uncharacterized protein n=1 Tax=uncultured bacterium (gcode 4) TaxID=1234023 RepID=K2GYG6_9BACT|nr:MAG: hypothetical protein ACD_3C00052G0001 [uncultured bacterium (gcode 4)]